MMSPNDPRHGTHNGYANLDCRCFRCREANRVYQNMYNHRTGRHRPLRDYLDSLPGREHGRIATYNAGCRCEECRRSARDAKRRQRQRMKERAA